jgi:hypothetical protein
MRRVAAVAAGIMKNTAAAMKAAVVNRDIIYIVSHPEFPDGIYIASGWNGQTSGGIR